MQNDNKIPGPFLQNIVQKLKYLKNLLQDILALSICQIQFSVTTENEKIFYQCSSVRPNLKTIALKKIKAFCKKTATPGHG